MTINIPVAPALVLERLLQGGYEAYVVGGCVRDALLGRTPHDWDVCTSARPEETMAAFGDFRVLETGLKHGTVTVLADGQGIEVTTYRVDGAYTDHRRPDGVEFVTSLRADLARRDFTVNAMAAALDGRITDCFDGQSDLAAGVIRCVGDPDQRFCEDALRILRGLRFAATYGFSIEKKTAEAAVRNRALLRHVAAERVRAELERLLLGSGVGEMLRGYPDIFGIFLPELLPAVGFLQQNPYHILDVWGHTALAVEQAPPDRLVRLTLLFHDLGKPQCFTLDADGVGHFYGHPARSADLAETCMKRLRFDSETVRIVRELVFYHDAVLPAHLRGLRRWLGRLGEVQLRRLIQVQRGDILAQAPDKAGPRLARLDKLTAQLEEILEAGDCCTIATLDISGRDLLALGVPPGRAVGALLRQLLEQVMDGAVPNEREALLRCVGELMGKI